MFSRSKPASAGFRRSSGPRNPFFPELALRRRSKNHPVAMFAIIAGACLAAMTAAPTSGPAVASFGHAPATPDDSGKGPRVGPMSEADFACKGQSWGHETPECLAAIASESGDRQVRPVRMIARAESGGGVSGGVY
jgi:hypothetical protein